MSFVCKHVRFFLLSRFKVVNWSFEHSFTFAIRKISKRFQRGFLHVCKVLHYLSFSHMVSLVESLVVARFHELLKVRIHHIIGFLGVQL
jgi:hypothetical protein